MPQNENQNIALVVSKDAGSDLLELSKENYIWVCHSQINDPYISQITTITTFNFGETESTEDVALDFLDSVFLHHPEWSRITLIGSMSTNELIKAFEANGASKFNLLTNGFVAFRTAE